MPSHQTILVLHAMRRSVVVLAFDCFPLMCPQIIIYVINARETTCYAVCSVHKPFPNLLGTMVHHLVCTSDVESNGLIMTHRVLCLGDNFACNTCQLKARPPNPDIDKDTLHRYTHTLVRCKDKIEDPQPSNQPTNSEIREGMLRLKENFDGRLSGLEDRLKGLEEKLIWLTENFGRTQVRSPKSDGGH